MAWQLRTLDAFGRGTRFISHQHMLAHSHKANPQAQTPVSGESVPSDLCRHEDRDSAQTYMQAKHSHE